MAKYAAERRTRESYLSVKYLFNIREELGSDSVNMKARDNRWLGESAIFRVLSRLRTDVHVHRVSSETLAEESTRSRKSRHGRRACNES